MKKNYLLLKLMIILFANVLTEGQISISNQSSDNVILFGRSRFQITPEIKML